MKSAFLVALAAPAILAGCAGASEHAFGPAPSQMSLAEIQAEIATNRAESRALYAGVAPRMPGETPVAPTPVVLYNTDSNGVPITSYSPDYTRYRYSASSSSRPYGYVRLQALSDRSARLYAELRQRPQSQE